MSTSLSFDARETDKVFEFRFKRFSEQMICVARWYAELSAKAKAVCYHLWKARPTKRIRPATEREKPQSTSCFRSQ
jgi:hypothetical protein